MGFRLRFEMVCIIVLCSACANSPSEYNRDDYSFTPYRLGTFIGYYTGLYCEDVEIDHLVSLADAHASGANEWSNLEKKRFANDKSNHVPACPSINRSKGSSSPSDFLRKSRDGTGIEFSFVDLCGYISRYIEIKAAYRLAITREELTLLEDCPENSQRIRY